MLDTRLTDDIALRCDALCDRVAATPIARNPHALKVALAECDAILRTLSDPFAICKLRDARHWLKLAYGGELHGYPPERLRAIVIAAVNGVRLTSQERGS